MKKFPLALALLTSATLHALPIGNPSAATLLTNGLIWEGHCADPFGTDHNWCNAYSVRIGFYGDYVFNRHLAVAEVHHDKDIEQAEIFTNAGFLALNFWDRMDLFTTFGATNLRINTNNKTFDLGGTGRLALVTETDFSWGVGVRGTIWECGCTQLGGEMQYVRTSPNVDRLTLNGMTSIYPHHHLQTTYQEWQLGVALSHRINQFYPYVGVKWSHCELKMDDAIVNFGTPAVPVNAKLFDLECKKDWGFAVGVTFVKCKTASCTVEGRFGDEKALYVNAQIRL